MANNLEQFVNGARTMSANGLYSQLYEYLKKSGDLLQKNINNLDTVLQTFKLDQHSLPILAILSVKFSHQSQLNLDAEQMLGQFTEFVMGCNVDQVEAAQEAFSGLCHMITTLLIEKKMAIRGLHPMSIAIEKLQRHPHQLTSIHADLVQLCLVSQCPWPALRFLDAEITDIKKEAVGPDPKRLLLYFYYGGLLYGSLKRFDEALHFFEACVTTPALVVSHIMLEAFKKHILLSLLVRGEVRPLPKFAPQVVNRFLKPLSQPYCDLAKAFTELNTREFDHLVSTHQDIFAKDKNSGLVKQCQLALERKRVARLTATFVSLSLEDVAMKAGFDSPQDAEWCILKMVLNREISARISQKDAVVEFLPNLDQDTGKLDECLGRVIQLDGRIRSLEEAIMLDPNFIQKSHVATDGDESPPGAGQQLQPGLLL
ncbi:unnamed protein product [Cyprideis torosa]|uniref:COP9 signalosome complex subunit 3 n=1 Tax=Cyprideis torosa TaxID=163714 RepID=A0A7R8W9S8_9CRUS|nr:unnamed protein product [Cyprideis torosa]CAG0885646.1 unnamed protein product [Cyprideis torosa]